MKAAVPCVLAINGGSSTPDPTFFSRSDELEADWKRARPVLDRWAAEPEDFPNYKGAVAVPAGVDGLPT